MKKPEKSVREQLDALDSVLGVDQSTNSDNFLDRMELLPFRATRKRDGIEKSALRPFNYGEGDDTRINNVSIRHNLFMYRHSLCSCYESPYAHIFFMYVSTYCIILCVYVYARPFVSSCTQYPVGAASARTVTQKCPSRQQQGSV